uniref:Col_cuticle_N domain-containing protein n=1 Tax=Romanomermis culicivorax TaxID=13658 RepID=A0A915KWK9_ROMCU
MTSETVIVGSVSVMLSLLSVSCLLWTLPILDRKIFEIKFQLDRDMMNFGSTSDQFWAKIERLREQVDGLNMWKQRNVRQGYRTSGSLCRCDDFTTCPSGPTGDIGEPGADGEPGAAGVAGIKGQPGKLYRPLVPPVTERCKICPEGQKGVTGQCGLPGLAGNKGPAGSPGAPGTNGATGPCGPKGESGMPGMNGKWFVLDF